MHVRMFVTTLVSHFRAEREGRKETHEFSCSPPPPDRKLTHTQPTSWQSQYTASLHPIPKTNDHIHTVYAVVSPAFFFKLRVFTPLWAWGNKAISICYDSAINMTLVQNTLWLTVWSGNDLNPINTNILVLCILPGFLNVVRITCRGGTSWGVQNRHKSFHRWARRRCKSSVCLPYFWAWSKSWGWQNKASPWYIHLHTPTHLFPRPWWMLQKGDFVCVMCACIYHKFSHFTIYHFASTASCFLLKCDPW